ncbi:hypothetical protein DAETH_34970 (plasmid) [Deinococcus aetherius]|uniref:VOC domain-containing protein n=1 Tax=Deinococcus aetherius TaxID=200252 RepID=A0ABN6RJM2_9DEIO|nr:hypothetical protein DAETH_34970 [Deinococcus aetherius]
MTLHTPDPKGQRAFYAGVLGFPLEDDATGLSLRAGSTLLRFVPGEAGGPYHFALNVPEDRFPGARAWLEERVALLPDDTGQTVFHSENWNADMVYFRDAGGNILELIARHTLPALPGSGFDVTDLLGVSELGVSVSDVPGTVRDLQGRFGLRTYGESSPTFTPLGDEEGLLIVVPVGRGWFPVGEPARRLPFHLRAHGERGVFDLEAP